MRIVRVTLGIDNTVQSPELSNRGLGVRVNDPFGNVKNFARFIGGLASRDQGQYFTLVPMTDAPRVQRLALTRPAA